MPALSTSTIAASDSASKAAAKTSARGADNSADGLPFANFLAATSQESQPRKPHTVTVAAANNNDSPPAKSTEPQSHMAQPALQSSSRTHGDDIISKDGGKRDKKADDGNNADAVVTAQQPQQSPQAQPLVLANVQTNVQSVPQVNSQAPGTAEDNTGLDAIDAAASGLSNSGAPVAQAGNMNGGPTGGKAVDVSPTDPQPVSQPVPMNDQNAPVAQNPAPAPQIAIADDDESAANDAPAGVPDVAKGGPAVRNKTSGGNAASDKAAGSGPTTNPPVDLQTASQPVPAANDEVVPVAQTVVSAPPAGASPGPMASNGSNDAATAAPLTDVSPAMAGNPDAKDTGPASKPTRTATNTDAPSPATTMPAPSPARPAATVPGNDGTNGTGSVPAASTRNDDSKPVHVAASDSAPQPPPDAPAPIAQAAPAPVLPQGMAIADFGVTAPVASGGGGTVTTSLHIATSDTDPTPNLNALAVSIAARSLSGAKQFEIRLDPPELGRVDVRLSIDANGKTQAHMTADQPQTLNLLQKDAPTLTQALRDAGLDVSQSGLNFSLRGQDRQNDDGGNGQGRRTNLTATRAIQAAQSPTAISFNGAAADARVDIHV